ncbi:hypothetical protein DPMN_119757 [Dreissena polymorpha]|uniref:Uncharacterized protein n=1 Tax=Dreissena polymorpha TaxID=45954 RepID=A0A9D4GIQ4_DREPO|nr:hypothetical protein DPMN_119757 [Dreissena polymorpha]
MHAFTFILTLALLASSIHGQLFTTTCSDGGGECDAFPNSVCDTAVMLVCVCPMARSYIANSDKTRCCGAVVNPANGTVATNATIPGSVATYACNPGFIIYGVNTRTCVVNTGWSGYQPTCVAGKLNDNCSGKFDLCATIANGQCSDGLCKCNAGYQDDGSDTNCININECVSDPCLNGATCVNGVAKYTCQCSAGWTGNNCQTDIDECAILPCKYAATCIDGLNTYQCTCATVFSGLNCETGYTGRLCETEIDECVLCEEGTAIPVCPSYYSGVARTGDFWKMLPIIRAGCSHGRYDAKC